MGGEISMAQIIFDIVLVILLAVSLFMMPKFILKYKMQKKLNDFNKKMKEKFEGLDDNIKVKLHKLELLVDARIEDDVGTLHRDIDLMHRQLDDLEHRTDAISKDVDEIKMDFQKIDWILKKESMRIKKKYKNYIKK
jgi:hypothetical protein